jgi:Zn-dependent protease
MGVPILLQPSWFVFAAVLVVVYGETLSERGDNGTVAASVFAVLLLASVVLHELGHCVAARLLGLPVRQITVSFLAGLTEITKLPQTPAREYAVSAAGPAVSLVLAGSATAGAMLAVDGSTTELVLGLVAGANLVVFVFNLLPGLPLDGGRVLHAALWRITGDEHRSTVASAYVGQAIALLVFPAAAVLAASSESDRFNPVSLVLALFVAVFLYAGASASLRSGRIAQRLPGLSAARLARAALPVPPDLPLSEALRRAQAQALHAIVVVDGDGRARGLVSEARVLATPEQQRPWIQISQLARTIERELVLDADLAGEDLVNALARTPATEYLVADAAGGPPGVLVATDVARALQA